AADFLAAVRFEGDGVSLDTCAALLPLLEELLRLVDAPRAAAAALSSALYLSRAFAPLVRDTLGLVGGGGIGGGGGGALGVDVAWEERRERCRRCHEGFARVQRVMSRAIYRDSRVQALAGEVERELNRYLWPER
ncbi:unnamed protein product, partial [Phaeothamnion confervicola]